MAADDTDDQGAPLIVRTQRKIDTLERRLEYLEEQIETTYGSPASFMRAEISALRSAILVLRHHRALVEGLEMPIDALADVMTALEASGLPLVSKPFVRRHTVVFHELGSFRI